MKSRKTLVGIVVTLLVVGLISCGGNTSVGDDAQDAVHEVSIDVTDDRDSEDGTDASHDAGSDVSNDVEFDVGADVVVDAVDAVDAVPDVAVEVMSDIDEVSDVGSDVSVQVCDGAVVLAAGTVVESSASSEPSVWQTYSCDDSATYEAPERLFRFAAGCAGFIRLIVSPSGDPMSLDYVPVAVAILSDCSPDACTDMTAPGHPVQYQMEVVSGQNVYFAVEGMGEVLPAFSIQVQEMCLNCLDADQDGHQGYNELYCPSGNDCNDVSSDVYPGKAEVLCDGVDQDCSGADSCSAIVCVDNDDDGYFNYDPVVCPTGRDCNDSSTALNPDADEINCNGIDEDCDGLDWCPGTGQQCDSCLIGGICRDDHVCVPSIGGLLGISANCMKLCENINQCPSGSTCVDGVYNGAGVCLADYTGKCDSNALTVTDSCGNVTYSATCPSACDAEGMVCVQSCPQPIPASLNTTITGRAIPGPSAMDGYPGAWGYEGSEQVYQFTSTCRGAASVKVTEMADMELGVFVMPGNCTNTSVVASGTEGSIVHEAELMIESGETYFVVVDSTVADDAGPFALLISTECGDVDVDHCGACRFNAQCRSGYCHRPGTLLEGACAGDCSVDGVCPDDSTCSAMAGGFVCMPDVVARCVGNALYMDDVCGLSYLAATCSDGTTCNPIARACTNDCVDGDLDGFVGFDENDCPFGVDCDDDNADVHPGSDDIRCNQVDEDCSGMDNCSDAGQCELCDGGHCSPGYFCWVDPSYDQPGVCLQNCTDDMECPSGDGLDLSCWSWMSGEGNDDFFCRPVVVRACQNGDDVVTDGCGRTLQTTDCDLNCFNNFGCVNRCAAASAHPGCGQTVHGTTSGAADRTDYYYNQSTTVDDLTGPEVAYTFVPSCSGDFNVVLSNAAKWLTVVVVKSSESSCSSASMVDYTTYIDEPKMVSFTAVAGQHYTLIVDGMDGAAGAFDLTVNCLCGTGCVDADSDGYIDHHDTDCPSGNDCDGTGAAIHPGASDVPCNDIDEDCSGYDDCRSHACTVDVDLGSLAEPVSGLFAATGGDDEMTFYGGACVSPYPRFNAEVVYHVKPTCDGTLTVAPADPLSDQFDIFLLEGACRADLCSAMAWYELSVPVVAGVDYFIVVDGTASGVNSWTLDAAIVCS